MLRLAFLYNGCLSTSLSLSAQWTFLVRFVHFPFNRHVPLQSSRSASIVTFPFNCHVPLQLSRSPSIVTFPFNRHFPHQLSLSPSIVTFPFNRHFPLQPSLSPSIVTFPFNCHFPLLSTVRLYSFFSYCVLCYTINTSIINNAYVTCTINKRHI